MNKRQIRVVFFWIVLAASLTLTVQADHAGKPSEKKMSEALGKQPCSPCADGKVPSIGTMVDIDDATWTNTIGAAELITVWGDPGFDSDVRRVYYARVLEKPTPRWTVYGATRFGVETLPDIRMTVTERACTLPIWYNPLAE